MTITYNTYTATGRKETHQGAIINQQAPYVIYVDKDGIQHKINLTSPHFYNVEIK